ncbi:MAG TPA: ABC transporter ATP-binding protein, partial [Anaerovoracaceae bacterium]|nr:ABC transporter ATP-binding protein [Anaerovoracaceae bacterium]
ELNVPEGALVALLGPSGCGKTTTLRLIAGFEPANEGDIYIDGERINNVAAHKRNIGVVFQSYALFPHMTVFENVAYGLEQRKFSKNVIRKKVDQMLDIVQLTEYRERKPRQLSGGQQQRVALARALVIEPKVVLLDECLSALDKKLRVEMQVELRRILSHFGATALFVTHDQEEALTLSDFIVVMDKGKIIQWGKPFKVYEEPKNRFVAGFLGKANFFDGKVLDRGIIKNTEMKTITLKTEQGIVTLPTAWPAEVGSNALYSVRPEKLILKSETEECGDQSEGCLYGKITIVTYVGNLSTYRIDCNGRELIAESQNVGETTVFSEGDFVKVAWEPEFCRLLED